MPDNPDSLSIQLSRRVAAFVKATGISQRKLAALIKTDETHLSSYLAGRTGLSTNKALGLLQLLNSSKEQVERKLGKVQVTSQILALQEGGRAMNLSNDGWVPQEGKDNDPNDSSDITSTPKAGGESDDEIIDVLRQVDNFHRQAREAIADWFASQGKPHPNAGSTEPPRKVSDPRTPGPKGDLFRVDPKEHLLFLQNQHREAEAELELQKQIKAEREATWNAQKELARLKKGKAIA